MWPSGMASNRTLLGCARPLRARAAFAKPRDVHGAMLDAGECLRLSIAHRHQPRIPTKAARPSHVLLPMPSATASKFCCIWHSRPRCAAVAFVRLHLARGTLRDVIEARRNHTARPHLFHVLAAVT